MVPRGSKDATLLDLNRIIRRNEEANRKLCQDLFLVDRENRMMKARESILSSIQCRVEQDLIIKNSPPFRELYQVEQERILSEFKAINILLGYKEKSWVYVGFTNPLEKDQRGGEALDRLHHERFCKHLKRNLEQMCQSAEVALRDSVRSHGPKIYGKMFFRVVYSDEVLQAGSKRSENILMKRF